MPTPAELEEKLWKAIRSDRTMMLGLAGVDEAHTRPMTGLLDGDGDHGPIWLFTATDTELAQEVKPGSRAIATFTGKGHDIFACIHGTLTRDNDRAVIDRLWNPFVAAWYEGGKTDPKLVLLRFDPEHAQIWENGSSLMAGIRAMLGIDPKQSYRDNVAEVKLG